MYGLLFRAVFLPRTHALLTDCYPSQMPSLLWAPWWWPGGLVRYPFWFEQITKTGVSHGQVPAGDGRASKYSYSLQTNSLESGPGGNGAHPLVHGLLPHVFGSIFWARKGDAALNRPTSGAAPPIPRGPWVPVPYLEGSALHRAPPTSSGAQGEGGGGHGSYRAVPLLPLALQVPALSPMTCFPSAPCLLPSRRPGRDVVGRALPRGGLHVAGHCSCGAVGAGGHRRGGTWRGGGGGLCVAWARAGERRGGFASCPREGSLAVPDA